MSVSGDSLLMAWPVCPYARRALEPGMHCPLAHEFSAMQAICSLAEHLHLLVQNSARFWSAVLS